MALGKIALGLGVLAATYMVGHENAPTVIDKQIVHEKAPEPIYLKYTERVEVPAKPSNVVPQVCTTALNWGIKLADTATAMGTAQGRTKNLVAEVKKNVFTKDTVIAGKLEQESRDLTQSLTVLTTDLGSQVYEYRMAKSDCEKATGN